MTVQINSDIGKLVRRSGRADYLLTWILGYVDTDKAKQLSLLLDLESLLGETQCQIELSQELTMSIRNHIAEGVSLDAAVNFFLITAILMGEGE